MLVENTAADGGKVQPHKVLSQQTHQSCRLIWEQLLCSIGAIHEPHFVIDHMKQAIGTALQDSTIHWGCSGWRARVQPGDTEAWTNQSTTGGGVYVQHTNTPKPIRDTCSGTCSGTCSSPSRTAWALSFCLNRKLICSCWRVRFFWQRQQTLFHLQSGLCRNCDDAGG